MTTTTRRPAFALAFLAILMAGTGADPAHAQSFSASETLSLKGYDLSLPGERGRLRRDIARAARRVCLRAGATDPGDLPECEQDARASAWQSVQTTIAARAGKTLTADAAGGH